MQAKTLIKFIVLVLSICFLAFYIYKNSASFYDLLDYSVCHAIGIAFLYIGYFSINSSVLFVSVKDYSYKCDYFLALKIATTSSLLSYAGLFKLGSIGYKTISLVNNCGMGVRDAAGIILISAYFSVLLNLLVTIAGVVFLQSIQWGYVFAILIFIASIAIIPFLHLQAGNANLAFLKILNKKLFQYFKVSSSWVFSLYLCLFLIQLVIGSIITYCLFDGLGHAVSFSKCVLITSISGLAMLISITPANLGVKEVIYLGLGGIIDVDGSLMVAISLIDRCIQFLVLFLLTLIFFSQGKVKA